MLRFRRHLPPDAAQKQEQAGAAYAQFAQLADRLTPQQREALAARYAEVSDSDDYQRAAETAADVAYTCGRVRRTHRNGDRVIGAGDDAPPLDDLVLVAGGSALDVAYAIITADLIPAGQVATLTGWWREMPAPLPMLPYAAHRSTVSRIVDDQADDAAAGGRARSAGKSAIVPQPRTSTPVRPSRRPASSPQRQRARRLRARAAVLAVPAVGCFLAAPVVAGYHSLAAGAGLLVVAVAAGMVAAVSAAGAGR